MLTPFSDFLSPPETSHTWREVTAPIEWLRTALSLSALRKLPKGDGRPIVLVPGYMADKWSMRPLRSFLRKLEYSAYDWELGRNRGDVDDDIVRLGRQVVELSHRVQAPVTLIGWSLGGVLSREVARLFPDAVHEVITMGTPISGGPKYTAVGQRYARRKGIDLDQFEHEVYARNQIGFDQPITVIFSKRDGIVGWQAAIDIYNDHALHLEVDCTHLGIGIHPQSWRYVALTLAGHRDQLTGLTGKQALGMP